MTTYPPCSCDEAKAWKARALAAELSLRFAHRNVERLLEKLDAVLRGINSAEEDETEDRVLGVHGEIVLASGVVSSTTSIRDLIGKAGG